jgi:7-cyano-7-deazaguanine synthase
MTDGPDLVAVLCSGGLDSVVLAAHLARAADVQPLYVSAGLAWENAERRALERLAETPAFTSRIRPVVSLQLPMRDIYGGGHWALTGAAPAYDTPDEDVYLPGRNLVLLTKAGVYCASAGIHRVAIGPLAGNPFPDATPEFFAAVAHALSLGLAHPIDVVAPFRDLEKSDVIRLGAALGVPMEWSLSCMSPQDGVHCGLCSKCRERRDAFDEAGVEDRTVYASPSPRGSTRPAP